MTEAGGKSATAQADQFRSDESRYRGRWTWDSVTWGTHCVDCYPGNCPYRVYVRDGQVLREESAASFGIVEEGVPDFNPMGCNKGAAWSQQLYDGDRLKYPMRRVGERGEGKWERISWDEAATDVANAMLDAIEEAGPATIVHEGTPEIATVVPTYRFFNTIGGRLLDLHASFNDFSIGLHETFGKFNPVSSADDWFHSELILVWHMNPAFTRIPFYHFMLEARYKGAEVVSISPDLNASHMHADYYVPMPSGNDVPFALAMVQVILEEGIADYTFIREQTDLPLLIRSDTRTFLRESDVVAGGKADRFAWWDAQKQSVVWSSSSGIADQAGKTLGLGPDERPDLEPADADVTLLSGERIALRTGFSILRDKLAAYDLERASKITGVHPNVISRFAREFAAAKSALIYAGAAMGKILHGDLVQRSQILLAAITGNNGRPGGGWQEMTFFELDGKILAAFADHPSDLSITDPAGIYGALMEMGRQQTTTPGYISGSLHMLFNGGTYETQLNPAYNDPTLPKTPEAYLREQIEKRELTNVPGPEFGSPDVIFNMFGNPFRHNRMGERLADTLFKKAKLVVDLTLRIDDTAHHSDILLPAASPYEKLGFKYSVAYPPYLHLADKAVEPLGEARSDWEALSLLIERVSAEARRRNVTEVTTYRGAKYDLTQAAWRFSDKGRIGPRDDEKIMRMILALSPATQGITLEALRANKGAMRYTGVSQLGRMWCGTSSYRPDEPLVPYQDYVVDKKPWPTLTGRQQFYIDHPLFIEVGEELPVHKDPPMAGGKYPLVMTCGHTRWSVHTLWRDVDILLQLQRGEPVIFVNPRDASRRGLADHDYAAVYNDLGEFVVRVKRTPAMRPGQVHIYHAWDAYQFENGRASDAICPSPLKVTQLVSYGHMPNSVGWNEPCQNDRDTRVDLRRHVARAS